MIDGREDKKGKKLTILAFGEKFWNSCLTNLTSPIIMPIKRRNTSSCNYQVLNHVLGTCRERKVSYFEASHQPHRRALTSCAAEDTHAGLQVLRHVTCVLSVNFCYQTPFPKNMLIFFF